MDRKIGKILAVLFLAVTFSCNKEDCNCGPEAPTGDSLVFIACEGSMGSGNSRLDIYDPRKDSIYTDVFASSNGQALGDVFQSVTRIGEHFYLCINNSDKIQVINEGYKLKATIGIPKPRYIAKVTDEKAYVSSLFSSKLYVLNLKTNTVTGTIELPFQNPEGMLLTGGKVYVAPWDTACGKIYVVSPLSDKITDSINIAGRAPQEILADKEQKLWVLAGNKAKGKQSTLTRIDPQTASILKNYHFPAEADPVRPQLNRSGDTLYFIGVDYAGAGNYNGIYRMGINDSGLPSQPFLRALQYQYFWALAISPWDGTIYVGDPKGFIQKGEVSVYSPDGTLIRRFPTGVGPGHLYFYSGL